MKIAILMDYNSYAGREYAGALRRDNIDFDIISIGDSNRSSEIEEKRCGNLWAPIKMEELLKTVKHYNFPSLKSEDLVNFLSEKKYDLGIQGGTGILRKDVFAKFKLGLLNFHPGDLPKYRGCSAPEWQIFEKHPVTSTCHLIDEGIDTGDIYKKKVLDLDLSNYHSLRASVYPSTALFVSEVVREIIENNGFKYPPLKQNDDEAVYHKYIGDDKIDYLIENFEKFKISL